MSLSITPPAVVEDRSMTGDAPTTSTVSCTWLTARVKDRRERWPRRTMIPFCSMVLKPVSSTRTSYRPGTRKGAMKRPSESVV